MERSDDVVRVLLHRRALLGQHRGRARPHDRDVRRVHDDGEDDQREHAEQELARGARVDPGHASGLSVSSDVDREGHVEVGAHFLGGLEMFLRRAARAARGPAWRRRAPATPAGGRGLLARPPCGPAWAPAACRRQWAPRPSRAGAGACASVAGVAAAGWAALGACCALVAVIATTAAATSAVARRRPRLLRVTRDAESEVIASAVPVVPVGEPEFRHRGALPARAADDVQRARRRSPPDRPRPRRERGCTV